MMAAGGREICRQLCRHRRAVLVTTIAMLVYDVYQAEDAASLGRAAVCTIMAMPAAVLDSLYGKLYHRASFALSSSGLLLAVLQEAMYGNGRLLSSMAGGALFGLLMLIVFVVGRGSMGFGDVCFAAGLGTFIPPEQIVQTFFLTFLLGGLAALMVCLSRAVRGMQPADRIPLGPFLTAACLLSILHGQQMMRWYLGGY